MFKILKNQTEVNETRPEKDCCHSSGLKHYATEQKWKHIRLYISQKDIETTDSDGRKKGEKLIKIMPSKLIYRNQEFALNPLFCCKQRFAEQKSCTAVSNSVQMLNGILQGSARENPRVRSQCCKLKTSRNVKAKYQDAKYRRN